MAGKHNARTGTRVRAGRIITRTLVTSAAVAAIAVLGMAPAAQATEYDCIGTTHPDPWNSPLPMCGI
jgi:hypothetical protein